MVEVGTVAGGAVTGGLPGGLVRGVRVINRRVGLTELHHGLDVTRITRETAYSRIALYGIRGKLPAISVKVCLHMLCTLRLSSSVLLLTGSSGLKETLRSVKLGGHRETSGGK